MNTPGFFPWDMVIFEGLEPGRMMGYGDDLGKHTKKRWNVTIFHG